MSIFSSIYGGIKSAATTVYNTVNSIGSAIGSAFSSGSQQASAGMAFPVGANMTASQTGTAQRTLGTSGGATGTWTTTPASSGSSTPVYGPVVPTTISAGGAKTSSTSSINSYGGSSSGSYGPSQPLSSYASVPQTRTMSAGSIGGGSSSLGSLSSTGGGSIVLPSGTGTGTPKTGPVNNTGLASVMSPTFKYDAATGTYQEVTADPNAQQQTPDQQRKQSFLEKLNLVPQKEDILNSPEIQAQNSIVNQRKQEVNAANAQLNAVIAKQNQDLLQLRQTGAQEGVTEAVYGGQANTINYEAGVRALPLQAAISAAQGNLSLAQDYLGQLTAMKTEQVNNAYNYRMAQYDAISGFVDNEQKIKLDALKTQDDRIYQQQQDFIKTQSTLLQSAVSQRAPTSVVQAISSAKTLQQAITAAGQYAGNVLEQRTNEVQYNNAVLQGQKLKAEIDASKPVTGEYAPVINAVSSLVGATKAPAVKNAIATSLASGDYNTAYANVANAVEDSLTGTNKTKFADARTDIGVMASMRDAIKQYTDAGGNLGYLKGTADTIAKKFGQIASDPKFASLGVQLTREFQSYRNNMTGAAFSPAESKEYASVNPRSNASLDLNLATVDGAIAQLSNRVTSTVNQRIPDAQKIYDLASGKTSSSQTIQSNGQTYEVGKVYNDGTANWTVDASGKWTKQ